LLEKEALIQSLGIITDGFAFYKEAHETVFNAMKQMYHAGKPVDTLTVIHELSTKGQLESVGGAYYLSELTSKVITGAHIDTHCRIVVEKYMLREQIRVCGEAVNAAYSGEEDVFDLISRVERELSNIVSNNVGSEVKTFSAVTKEGIEDLEKQRNSTKTHTGVTTGFHELDRRTGGWSEENLIIIAARPAVGKSAFAINLGVNAAMNNQPGAFFSLEMGYLEIWRRIICATCGVTHDSLKKPKEMSPVEYEVMIKNAMQKMNLPLFIDDTPAITPMQLRAKAHRLKKKFNIQWLIVDYLQLMQGDGKKSFNREGEISQISRDLKKLAKELHIPIIALSQLSRDVEKRGDATPRLSDLRESGAIEQDADEVHFLYGAPLADDKRGVDEDRVKDVILLTAKDRDGSTGELVFQFHREYQKFVENGSTPFHSPAQFDNPSAGILKPPLHIPPNYWQDNM